MEARRLLLQVVEVEPENEIAWIWLSGLVDSLEDKLIACENALTLNPSNEKVRAHLYRLLRQQDSGDLRGARSAALREGAKVGASSRSAAESVDLRGLARRHEAEGRLDEAIRALADLASNTTDSYQFDRIFREITRIEAIQKEQILHVAPASTILRMTLSWPLLYLFLALVQASLDPFTRSAWLLWVGLPVVVGGAFLLAVAEVRAPHRIWSSVFSEEDDLGSAAARLAAAIAGWILVGIPHVVLLLDSLNRLRIFQVPYPPLSGG